MRPDSLARDLRFALRLLGRTPIVSGVALLSLALGIGANVAIFSLVNALLVRPLPVEDPAQLVQVQFSRDGDRPTTSLTYPQWEYIRDHQDVLAGVFAAGTARFNLNAGGEMRPAQGIWASSRYFQVLGVRPLLGRGFDEEDDRRGGGPDGPAVVISHGFWQREFGGDAGVLGRTLRLDGHAFTVVGVMPADFFGTNVGRAFDVIVPFGAEPIIRGADSLLDRRSAWWLGVAGRLQPGETAEAAALRFRALVPGLREATMPQDWRPQDQADYLSDRLDLVSAATGTAGSPLRQRYGRPLFVLLGIVALVLLIACANMANLLLAQSVARRRELAIRLSLGASRARLVRQLLVESLLLSGAGAVAGLALAAWTSRALVGMLSTRTVPVDVDLSLDWRVFAFTAAVAVVTGLLFGVAPAFWSTRVHPGEALRDQGRGIVGSTRPGLGHLLVAAQVALSFVLVCGAMLFVRTLVALTSQDVGFDATGVVVATLDVRRTATPPDGRLALFERVREAVAAAPGVDAAALSFVTPVSGSSWNMRIAVPGYSEAGREPSSLVNGVSPGYFRAMGTPLLSGRDFTSADTDEAPDVVIVNEAFARKAFGQDNPVGRTFDLDGYAQFPTRRLEIVGIAADSAYRSLRDPLPPTMFAPVTQEPRIASDVRMVVRASTSYAATQAATLAAVASIDDDIVVSLKTLEEDLNAAVLQERLVALLSASFGVLALLLAALGPVRRDGAFSVARRTNEIGIRIALGAEPRRVAGLVARQVLLVTAGGPPPAPPP
ncbi:MAG: ABC transporter permease [Vicinamibacterales bacterium]